MDANVIKEYLVSLGMKVDQQGFDKFNKTLQEASTTVQSFTSGMTKAFIGASATITTAISGVIATTTALIDETAKLDLQYQKLGLHMFMAADQAKKYKIVTDAMGENINDIAWIPELRQRYTQLMSQTQQMNLPGDAEGQMKHIRDVRFEFTRLRVEGTYAIQWIGYYLMKYLAGPINSIQSGMKSFNDWLTTAMPVWTEKIAFWLSNFLKLAQALWRGIKDVYDVLKRTFDEVWSHLDKGQKAFIGFGAVLLGLVTMGPFGLFIGALVTVALLLDDFYAYIDGRKSSTTLAPIWKQLLDWNKEYGPSIKEIGSYIGETLSKAINFLTELLGNLYKVLSNIIRTIATTITKDGVFTAFKNTFWKISDAVGMLVNGLINVLKHMGIISQDTKFISFWELVGHVITSSIKTTLSYVNVIAGLVKAVGQIMSGDYSGAWNTLKSIPGELIRDIVSANSAGTAGAGSGGVRGGLRGGFYGGSGSDGNGVSQNFMDSLATNAEGGSYDSPGHMDEGFWNLGGKYQILAQNWPTWCQEAGLPSDAPYTPQNQEIVARYQMNKAYKKYNGNLGAVAAWWNGGEGGANSYLRNGSNSYEAEYVSKALSGISDGGNSWASRSGIGSGETSTNAPANNGTVVHTTIGSITIHAPSSDPKAVVQAVANYFNNNNFYSTRSFSGIASS